MLEMSSTYSVCSVETLVSRDVNMLVLYVRWAEGSRICNLETRCSVSGLVLSRN